MRAFSKANLGKKGKTIMANLLAIERDLGQAFLKLVLELPQEMAKLKLHRWEGAYCAPTDVHNRKAIFSVFGGLLSEHLDPSPSSNTIANEEMHCQKVSATFSALSEIRQIPGKTNVIFCRGPFFGCVIAQASFSHRAS